MHRRSFVALAAVVPLAGCSSLLGGGVDETLEDDQRVEFTADDGAELTVSVEVQEIFQPSEVDVEREGIMLRIDHVENGIVDTWTIEGSETFEITVDSGGTHAVIVSGGVADVTIE
ncbi:hypothetical protein D8Y22_07360 [Salinadaptatus halalkaliphilus]|uniref:Uncharacterized protein n=1 Tax=Salinadaptatus halalkaliphilus TaxID=2419781 RepID=A0A4S3TMR6_9EURY|nr:hypothetical protein [Salinadaptatus halalkaliphilus]THE65522.1 hypothetical protein D8Y22_07360 [Salinadaptatus halalkaliphilus]